MSKSFNCYLKTRREAPLYVFISSRENIKEKFEYKTEGISVKLWFDVLYLERSVIKYIKLWLCIKY